MNNNNITITGDNNDNITYATASGLRSAVSIYCTFETTYGGTNPWNPTPSTQTYYTTGSGVIYKLESDGSAFIVTNYHVVYDSNSNTDNHISDKIYIYLYGLESEEYAIPATYVGGSANYEDLFVKQLQEKSVQEAKKELARKKRELEKTEKRIAELDKLFMRIYEDNVSGKLSDDHFSKMSIIYEDEQKEKKALAERLRAELDKDKEQNDGIEKFIAKVKAITDIQELTPEIVREFISRIDVYAPYRENNQRYQRIDIYYHGVGYVFIPEPEEVEEMFQEHLRDRKDNIKVKTA